MKDLDFEEYSGLILDTNIVIYTSNTTTWKELYSPVIAGKKLFISFITLAELLEDAYRRNMGQRRISAYTEMIISRYTLLPYTPQICDAFGRVRAERRNRPISVPDAFIAATAVLYRIPLVTHNRKDFEDITALKIISKC